MQIDLVVYVESFCYSEYIINHFGIMLKLQVFYCFPLRSLSEPMGYQAGKCLLALSGMARASRHTLYSLATEIILLRAIRRL